MGQSRAGRLCSREKSCSASNDASLPLTDPAPTPFPLHRVTGPWGGITQAWGNRERAGCAAVRRAALHQTMPPSPDPPRHPPPPTPPAPASPPAAPPASPPLPPPDSPPLSLPPTLLPSLPQPPPPSQPHSRLPPLPPQLRHSHLRPPSHCPRTPPRLHCL
ncbi:unnamed protein product [Closterium sp. NIES-54]